MNRLRRAETLCLVGVVLWFLGTSIHMSRTDGRGGPPVAVVWTGTALIVCGGLIGLIDNWRHGRSRIATTVVAVVALVAAVFLGALLAQLML